MAQSHEATGLLRETSTEPAEGEESCTEEEESEAQRGRSQADLEWQSFICEVEYVFFYMTSNYRKIPETTTGPMFIAHRFPTGMIDCHESSSIY